MNEADKSKPPKRIKALFMLHWKGKLPLVISYWVVGWLLQLVLAAALTFGLLSLGRFMGTGYFWLAAAVFSVSALTIWCNVGIWRSATHYGKASPRIWGLLAKVTVMLALIGFVLQVAPILVLIFVGGH